MLAIRLQRIGKKNRPSYRVVVSEHKRDLYGKHNEILGNYDPVAEPKTINLEADRIKYWISKGAKPSATVQNLLVKQGILEEKKVKSWRPKKKSAQGGSDSVGKDKKDEGAEKPKPEEKKEEKPEEPKESAKEEPKEEPKQEAK